MEGSAIESHRRDIAIVARKVSRWLLKKCFLSLWFNYTSENDGGGKSFLSWGRPSKWTPRVSSVRSTAQSLVLSFWSGYESFGKVHGVFL